jgi:hypothetical protein
MRDASTEIRPAYSEPELRPMWDDEKDEDVNVLDCGWTIGGNCNISVGHTFTAVDTEGIPTGPVGITVALDGSITQRLVTGEQLVAFGQMLINLGERSQ